MFAAEKAKNVAVKAALEELRKNTGHGPWHFYSPEKKVALTIGSVVGIGLIILIAATFASVPDEGIEVSTCNFRDEQVIFYISTMHTRESRDVISNWTVGERAQKVLDDKAYVQNPGQCTLPRSMSCKRDGPFISQREGTSFYVEIDIQGQLFTEAAPVTCGVSKFTFFVDKERMDYINH